MKSASCRPPSSALIFSTAVALISAALLATRSAQAADWPQFRGPNRDGVSTETNWTTAWPANGPAKLWSASVGAGFSDVAISKGKLYTMGGVKDAGPASQGFTKGQDTIYCLDAMTGKEIWHYTYPAAFASWDGQSKLYPGTRATPTVDGEFVYTMSLDAQLLCLTADKGKVVWQKNLLETYGIDKGEYRWGFSSSPLIDGNVLYESLGAGACALEKATGKEIWHWHDDQGGTGDNVSAGFASSVLFDNGGQKALAVLTKSLVALDPANNGKELWRVGGWQPYGHGLNAADPIFVGNEVFLSQGNYTRDCGVFRFSGNSSKAQTVWRLANKGLLVDFHTPALYKGNLYGFHDGTDPHSKDNGQNNGKSFCCLEFATGKTLWSSTDLSVDKYGTLTLADGKLIMLTDKGELIVADASPEGLKVLARAKVIAGPAWVTPVLANGLIYCRNNKGDLICLDVRKK